MLSTFRRKLASLTPAWRLTLVLALTAIGATHCAPMTWNDESRMASIQSLVETKSFVIDRTDFVSTGDKVFIGGHFYSDKPPMPALLGALVYGPLHLLGLRLREGTTVAYFLVTLLTVGVAWLFGTLAFFHSLAFTDMAAERRLLPSIVLGLGTIYLSWSTTFNNHALAAGFLALGFCFLLRARNEARTALNLGLAGLFFSLAGACDIPTSVFYVLFFAEVLLRADLRKWAVVYLLPTLLTIVPTLAVNYSIHHSIMPVQIYRSYFQYPGSPWLGSDELSGMETNDPAFFASYAVKTLVGPKGFLLYNPFLIVALWGLAREIRGKGRFCIEAICVGAGSSVILVYYWATTNNYGGWSYSIRWFVPLIPLVLFFSHPFFQHYDRRRAAYFHILLVVSLMLAFVGAINPWSPVTYSEISFVANIKQFVEHLRHPKYIRSRPG